MSSAALRETTPAAPPPRPVPPKRGRGRGRLARWILPAAAIGSLALALFDPLDEPLRRSMEDRMNRSLKGYRVRIASLHLQPFGGAMTLRGVEIRQIANPEPPIAVIPRLTASVEWRQLVFLRLVADFVIEAPRVYMNLSQLRGEASNPVPVRQRGWQQAVEAIYPLKINHLRVDDASVVYVDDDPARPLRLTHLNLKASNIRNIHSRERTYPSPIALEAAVFDSGRAVLEGNADFLAEPHFGIQGRLRLTEIPLDRLRPLANHWNIETRHGTLTASGEVEYGPAVQRVSIPTVSLRDVQVDYVRRPPARAGKALLAGAKLAASPPSAPRQAWDVRVDRLELSNANVGFRNETRTPPYRVYIGAANLVVTGFSAGPSGHDGVAVLRGRFMDSGTLTARATFRPGRGEPDFRLHLSIEDTDMRRMNDLFRAHGKFDVAAGTFSLYSEVRVSDGEVNGYVKPLFQQVEIYDSRQDAHKGFLRKVYESAVDAASKLLRNQRRDQVATSVDLHGPVSGPRTSTVQAIAGLIENAFIKAILPGFDRQVGTRPSR